MTAYLKKGTIHITLLSVYWTETYLFAVEITIFLDNVQDKCHYKYDKCHNAR
jgi:hypothetical protein